jgi:hypothetical protein
MRSVSADSSPYARLRRALDRGSLIQAEAAARECKTLGPEDSLRLLMLLLHERDDRYERAAVRWLGKLLAERPHIGLEKAEEAAGALADLAGVMPEVARSRLAFLLRHIGLDQAAVALEKA